MSKRPVEFYKFCNSCQKPYPLFEKDIGKFEDFFCSLQCFIEHPLPLSEEDRSRAAESFSQRNIYEEHLLGTRREK